MRNRIFAVFAIAVLAGGGLAYGTYNLVQNQPAAALPWRPSRSSSPPPTFSSAPS